MASLSSWRASLIIMPLLVTLLALVSNIMVVAAGVASIDYMDLTTNINTPSTHDPDMMYDTKWQTQALEPSLEWSDFTLQAITATTETIRVGSEYQYDPIRLAYCDPGYVNAVSDNVTNAAILEAAGGLIIEDINDGSGQQWLYVPQINITDTITFIINLNCWDNNTLPIVVNNTYTLIYIVDPLETANISIPTITTVYGDTATRSIMVRCGGGSGQHALYNGSDTESLLLNGSTSYAFTISSSQPIALVWTFTCANILTSPVSVATTKFVFNVNGCRTLPTGSLSYCEGIVPYPIDSRIDILEADSRARALYENDVYNHWNGTGWLPSPNVTEVYDNTTGTYSNVTDTITTISSNCLAIRRRWYCAQLFPYCLQSAWPNYQIGPCREICSMVIHQIRCGSEYDNYPQCHLEVDALLAVPTSQEDTHTGFNSITGFPELNITVRSYPEDGLCAAAHHIITAPSFISLILLSMMVIITNMMVTRR